MKILLIEDEKKVASFIKRGLEEEFFTVDVAYHGEKGETDEAGSFPLSKLCHELLSWLNFKFL